MVTATFLNRNKNKQKYEDFFKQFEEIEYNWIPPLAAKVGENSHVLARFIAEVLAKVASEPDKYAGHLDTRFIFARQLSKLVSPKLEGILSNIEKSVKTVENAVGEVSAEVLRDANLTTDFFAPAIESLAETVENHPKMLFLLVNSDLLREAFGSYGESLEVFFSIVPALSSRAAATLPEMKEVLFSALFSLKETERKALYSLAEDILSQVYQQQVLPRLEKVLSTDPRGKVLTPILGGAISVIPGESCLNAVLSIACTPRPQLTTGRMMALAIQELGGLYIKVSQVLAEICPPSLARELRTSQDDAGGLYPSVERSWKYVLSCINLGSLQDWREKIIIPEQPEQHFASASVGALYEFQLSEKGKQELGIQTVLFKFQRPGLRELFKKQANHLLGLCQEAKILVEKDKNQMSDSLAGELFGIISTIRRSVLNYHNQSEAELDFTQEKSNAERVREALRYQSDIRVPRCFFANQTIVIMERMPGTKVTKIVQTKYLERREISDTISRAYLALLFSHGVVWADPHPGNILYDDVTNKVAMIDLNPCFVWTIRTREQFKHLLSRLILRDANGVYLTLFGLVESSDDLSNSSVVDDLEKFLNSPFSMSSLVRFVGEFIKALNEHNIELRVEVQAALRGLSQLALTANSISARNSFNTLLRQQFAIKEIMKTAFQVGLGRVIIVITRLLFDITRLIPEEDVGPVLDERDIASLSSHLMELRKASVCNIVFSRISPEDNMELRLSPDNSYLMVTSSLRLEILEKRRPATVRYVVEIPNRQWLKERQEFVKLSSIARNFCIIESLEQLRRYSLDDYWRTVEAWSKPPDKLTVEESALLGEVKAAARKLYALRFRKIWDSPLSGLPRRAARAWSALLYFESRRETIKTNYLLSVSKKMGNIVFRNIAFGSVYRIRMIFFELVIWLLRKYIKSFRYAMNLLPMSTDELDKVILFNLARGGLSHLERRNIQRKAARRKKLGKKTRY